MFSCVFGRIRGSQDRSARRQQLALRPTLDGTETLESRKLLSTATARAGAYEVTVSTRNIGSRDVDVYASLRRNGVLVKNNIPVATSSRVEEDPVVSINANGRFAVAWKDELSSSDSDIKLRVYNSAGNPLISALTVNNSTRRESDPSVSINAAGRIVVAYTQRVTSSNLDVLAKQYLPSNSAGSSYSNTSFTVASDSARNEYDPNVKVAANGNWAVAYTRRFSSSDTDVFAFVRRTNGTTTRKVVVETSSIEDNAVVETYTGSSSLKVSYLRLGSRVSKTISV